MNYAIYKPEEIKDFELAADKIIFSEEFRRLRNKTQLFSAHKGDHYRNRLTHTLEVKAIAISLTRAIENLLEEKFGATKLYVSQELVEAIALGHDIGHTPFGHIGERTLQKILKREDNLGGLIFTEDIKTSTVREAWENAILNRTFFKHNLNSVEILKNIYELTDEDKCPWQILDGILKHTGIQYKTDKTNNFNSIIYVLKGTAVYSQYKEYSLNDYKNALTLEGQIVAVADEIAQAAADIDDSLQANRVIPSVLSILPVQAYKVPLKRLKKICLEEIKKSLIKDVVSFFQNKIKDRQCFEDIFKQSKTGDYILTEKMIDFTGSEDTEETQKNKKATIDRYLFCQAKNKKDFMRELSGYYKLYYIQRLIRQEVTEAEEIRNFDSKAEHIIRQLFKAYYNNPHQLNDTVIKIIIKDYRELSKKEEFKKEIGDMQLSEMFSNKINFADFDKIVSFLKKENTICSDIDAVVIFGNILLKNIAAYIAGMTDDFALQQYQQLYNN